MQPTCLERFNALVKWMTEQVPGAVAETLISGEWYKVELLVNGDQVLFLKVTDIVLKNKDYGQLVHELSKPGVLADVAGGSRLRVTWTLKGGLQVERK